MTTVCCVDDAGFGAVTTDVTNWVEGGADDAVEVDVVTGGVDEVEVVSMCETLDDVVPPPGVETAVEDVSEDCDDNGTDDDDDIMARKRACEGAERARVQRKGKREWLTGCCGVGHIGNNVANAMANCALSVEWRPGRVRGRGSQCGSSLATATAGLRAMERRVPSAEPQPAMRPNVWVSAASSESGVEDDRRPAREERGGRDRGGL